MNAATSLKPDEMTTFLNDFRQTLSDASTKLMEISEAQSERPREEGKWSAKQVIGHLIDSAANNHQRFVRAQFSDELVFPGYAQEDWIRVQHYQEESWSDLVQLWKLYNQHIVHLMSHVTDEARTKLRRKHNLPVIASELISVDEPVTLDFFMRDYVDHMKKHLGQIFGSK